jgi:hypothetical protein
VKKATRIAAARRRSDPTLVPARDRVRAALACVDNERARAVRIEDGCLVVDYAPGPKSAGYLRFRPETAGWVLEKVLTGGTFRWVARARAKTLDELIGRWKNARLLSADIYCELTAAAKVALQALLASPWRRVPGAPRAPRVERAAIRAALETALATHDAWLVKQLGKLTYKPPLRLRRIQLEWDPMALHDGLSWGAGATDYAGDEANEAAPSLRGRDLWPREIGRRIGAGEPGWHETAWACIEAWVLEGYRRARPEPPCAVYLSVHEGLDRGLNLATGRRTTFRTE